MALRAQRKNPEGEQEFASLWLMGISCVWSEMSVLTLLYFMFHGCHIQ